MSVCETKQLAHVIVIQERISFHTLFQLVLSLQHTFELFEPFRDLNEHFLDGLTVYL